VPPPRPRVSPAGDARPAPDVPPTREGGEDVPYAAVDFGQGISNAWTSIATFVPKLLAFLLIMFIGWLVAKAIAKAVVKVLERVGFDRVVERGGINRMLARSSFGASDIIAKLLYYAILLITLQIAFSAFGPNPVSAVLADVVTWLPRAVVAIVIVVVAGAIARAVRDLVTGALSGLSYGGLLGTMASVFVWGLGIIAALNQIGVATAVTLPVLITVLATIGGIAIVGVGGGLVRPMQSRWDRWLNRAEDEIPHARAVADAYQRGREDVARTAGAAAPTTLPATEPTMAQPAPAGQRQPGMPGDMPSGVMPAGMPGGRYGREMPRRFPPDSGQPPRR
jgi:uncharacterized membrane protein